MEEKGDGAQNAVIHGRNSVLVMILRVHHAHVHLEDAEGDHGHLHLAAQSRHRRVNTALGLVTRTLCPDRRLSHHRTPSRLRPEDVVVREAGETNHHLTTQKII